jgi:hypothetical protein
LCPAFLAFCFAADSSHSITVRKGDFGRARPRFRPFLRTV